MSDKKNNFFNRKEANVVKIPEAGPYDPNNMDDLLSCGIIDGKSFTERHTGLFNNLIVDSKNENPVATVAKRLEETFSPRELAFLMSKDLLITSYEQAQEQIKKEN